MQPHHTFLADLHETFKKAQLHSGVKKRYFNIGPHTVCMQFAGQNLVSDMTPALEHLEIAMSQNPDLTIFLWDDYMTRTKMPPFPWDEYPGNQHASIVKQLNTETMYVTYNAALQMLNVYDLPSKTAFFWLSDARSIPSSELSNPLKTILHKFLMPKGAFLVHAGAVGTQSGGVLLVGKGGSGKSTTTLSCLSSELSFAGDDYVLVSKGSTPTVHSVYSSARVFKDNIGRVPHIVSSIIEKPHLTQDKAHVFLSQMWQEKLISQFPLRAVFLPHVTGNRDTKLIPAVTKDAIQALILSTVVQLPQTDPQAVQELIKIIQSVPVYHLNLGTEMSQIPQAIVNYLKKSK